VHGSESDIYHALVNLGLNAVQAIEERGAADGDRLGIGASPYVAPVDDPHGLAPGSYVHVCVSDTGPGMSPEVRVRAFDPLFSTKQRGVRKGQGLGLTMVYRTVVTAHGGAIDVETEEGKGTVFHLYLPAGRRLTASAAAQVTTGNASAEAATILIVEDEEQIVNLARSILERAGHRVIVAADGAQGVEQFTRHASEIDLVILDITLPKLGGEDVMREVLRQCPSMKIILSSGNRMKIPADRTGDVRLLPKPYAPSDLLSTVRSMLE
jgi:CheY-like chemotaxis protein